MREASIVKIISPCEEDITAIIEVLQKSLFVATTSKVIHDKVKQKYFQFLTVVGETK